MNNKGMNTIVKVLAIAVVMYLVYSCMTSGYTGFPVSISSKGSCENGVDMSKLTYDLKCTPGSPTGDYYTKSLTPGGYCDFQKAVNDCSSYKLLDDKKSVMLGD